MKKLFTVLILVSTFSLGGCFEGYRDDLAFSLYKLQIQGLDLALNNKLTKEHLQEIVVRVWAHKEEDRIIARKYYSTLSDEQLKRHAMVTKEALKLLLIHKRRLV